MTGPGSSAAGGLSLSDGRGRWVLLAAVLGSGVAFLDATVVNIALPQIGTSLDAGFAGLQWTVNGYALTLASLILLGGSLGDRYGRRRIFVLGMVWFAAASLLCGLAPNIEFLVAARVLQGVGGALMTPGSLALIQSSFRQEDRSRAIGVWSGLGGVAGAAAPFVGGALLHVSWRLVFLINLPLAVVVVLIARRHVPESSDAGASPHVDVLGAVLVTLGLAGTTYALMGLGEGRGADEVVAGVVGVLGLVGFLIVERRSGHPMMPLDIFASRQFTVVNLVTLIVYAALGAFIFLVVLQLQLVSGFSPLVSGAVLLPVTVMMLLLSPRAGALAQRIGPRLPMTVGPLVGAVGLLMLLQVGRDASFLIDVLPGLLVFGLGLSATVAPLTATVLAAVPVRHAGVASGVNNAVARAAGLFAVAALPAVGGITGADYRDPVAFDHGFRVAMTACAGLLALGGILSGLLVRNVLAAPDEET